MIAARNAAICSNIFINVNLIYMRPIKLCLVLAAACISFDYADAQASDKTQRTVGIKTENIRVEGGCDMCKKKIEKAAVSIDGIKSAVWNEETKLLTVKYNVFKKEAIDNVQKKISSAGYDTEKYTAGDASLQKSFCHCGHTRKES